MTTNADVEATLISQPGENGCERQRPAHAEREHALPCVHASGRPVQLHRRLRAPTSSQPATTRLAFQLPGTVFGGQHAWNIGNSFAYAVIPFPGPVGGGYSNIISPDATSVLSFLTAVSSHEMVEASTDAEAYVNRQRNGHGIRLVFFTARGGPRLDRRRHRDRRSAHRRRCLVRR